MSSVIFSNLDQGKKVSQRLQALGAQRTFDSQTLFNGLLRELKTSLKFYKLGSTRFAGTS